MVDVVQLVRASDCGSECRGFESHLPPVRNPANRQGFLFVAEKQQREIFVKISLLVCLPIADCRPAWRV